jgi:MFS superfamily sulfate permease-like transporter
LGGALGDLGTFIPLLVGMVTNCGLQLGPALFCAGLINVTTGLMFGIPLAVQPMKAIATVAIGEGMNESQILVAGVATSITILVLALTGTVGWLHRKLPLSLIRGLQLALGLKLLTTGMGMVSGTNVLFAWDSQITGLLCGVIVLVLFNSQRIPAALLVFGIGLVALLAGTPELLSHTEFGITWKLPSLPNWNDLATGVWHGAVPQIPLTTLNSVIAVSALSYDLFPLRPAEPRKIAISVGLMNLICCPLGGMPMCHGAGGLAAQYRFGARTGGSIVALGGIMMVLALLFGGSLLLWLQEYPRSVLGVLLIFSGLELAMVSRDQTKRANFFIMLLTAGLCLGINTAVGFVIGWLVALLIKRGFVRLDTKSN